LQMAHEQLMSIHRLETPQQQTRNVDESEKKVQFSNGQQPVIVKMSGVSDAVQANTQEVNMKSENNATGEAGKLLVRAIRSIEEQSSYYLDQIPDWLEWTLYIIGVVVGGMVICFLHMAKFRPVHGCATVLCVLYCCPCGFLSLCFPLDEATPGFISSQPPVDEPSGANVGGAQHENVEDNSGRSDQQPAPAEGEVAQ